MTKMNRKILLFSGLTIIVAIFLIMMSHKGPPHILKTAEEEMPDFKFQRIDGGFIQTSDIDDEKFTLLWFFNSECDICITEIRSLADSISLLNNCQIMLVSYENPIKVADFYNQFQLMKFTAVQVGYLPYDSIINTFKIYAVPTLYVYHPNKRMIKYKPGPVTIQEIVEYLK